MAQHDAALIARRRSARRQLTGRRQAGPALAPLPSIRIKHRRDAGRQVSEYRCRPEPLSVRDVQQLLLPDELVLSRHRHQATAETFVWIVTRELARAYPVRTEPE
jgi:hypothetical protein